MLLKILSKKMKFSFSVTCSIFLCKDKVQISSPAKLIMEVDLSNTDVSLLTTSRALRALSKAGDQCRERTGIRDQEMPGFSMSQKSHVESTTALNNLQL